MLTERELVIYAGLILRCENPPPWRISYVVTILNEVQRAAVNPIGSRLANAEKMLAKMTPVLRERDELLARAERSDATAAEAIKRVVELTRHLDCARDSLRSCRGDELVAAAGKRVAAATIDALGEQLSDYARRLALMLVERFHRFFERRNERFKGLLLHLQIGFRPFLRLIKCRARHIEKRAAASLHHLVRHGLKRGLHPALQVSCALTH